MKHKKLKSMFCLSFLLMNIFALPLQVAAAEGTLKKEAVIVVEEREEYSEVAENTFPETIKENGKTYTRNALDYTLGEMEYLDKREKTVELTDEPKGTMTEDGVTYDLVASESTERIVGVTSQAVTAYEDYDHAISYGDVPATKTVRAINELTGEPEAVVCTLSGIVPMGWETVNNQMTVTFHDYDASFYEWNGWILERNDMTPPLAGLESELLASVGAAEGSTITGYSWAGEPYVVDGVTYRDATATVQQRVQMYRANYTGTLDQEQMETVYHATYSAVDTTGNFIRTVNVSAEYVQETSYVPYVMAGIGIVILAALIVAILFFLKRKKERKVGE